MSPGDAVEYRSTIRELPASERPRQRLRERGAFAPEAPEAVIDPGPFLAKLEPLGVNIKEREG